MSEEKELLYGEDLCGNCGFPLEDSDKKEEYNGWCQECIEQEWWSMTYCDY
jgi:hypothetical protein